MHIPGDSPLPFGCVWGTVQNAAPGYPVVIQIYKMTSQFTLHKPT